MKKSRFLKIFLPILVAVSAIFGFFIIKNLSAGELRTISSEAELYSFYERHDIAGDNLFLRFLSLPFSLYDLNSGYNYSLSLKKGDSFEIKQTAVDQPVSWKSSSTAKAFVSEKGMIYARKTGTAIISGKVNNKTVKIKVTVT